MILVNRFRELPAEAVIGIVINRHRMTVHVNFHIDFDCIFIEMVKGSACRCRCRCCAGTRLEAKPSFAPLREEEAANLEGSRAADHESPTGAGEN